MAIKALDHVNIYSRDVEGTVAFYTEVVGLTIGWRPPFDFPGAWLYCGDRAVIHLVGRDPVSQGSGAVDHVAFECDDVVGTRARLEARGIPVEERDVPGLGLKQLFLRDPNGVKLELNFAA